MRFYEGIAFPILFDIPTNLGNIDHEPTTYGIQYNHRGRFYLQIGDGPREEAEGSFVFLTFPGIRFRYGNATQGTRYHAGICATGERVRRYVEGGLMELRRKSPIIPIRNPALFLQTLQECHFLLKSSLEIPPKAVWLYESLLLQIRENALPHETPALFHQEELRRLLDRIGKNPEKEFDFSAEAKKIHVTEAHFRRIFRQFSGTSPMHCVLLHRLRKSTELLRQKRFSIAEVAECCGFKNQFYYSSAFKKIYRLSPFAYRREYAADSVPFNAAAGGNFNVPDV